MKIKGNAWLFGDHLNTDLIYPTRFTSTSDTNEMAVHCMEDFDKSFIHKIHKGDLIVAGINFGCGSSREHAPSSIKAAGISCIIAKSFSRIFYRNAINIGLPILECPEAVDDTKEGDTISVDFVSGTIINERLQKSYQVQPFPEFMQKIIQCGGLIKKIIFNNETEGKKGD